jgi:hypothetical protein
MPDVVLRCINPLLACTKLATAMRIKLVEKDFMVFT